MWCGEGAAANLLSPVIVLIHPLKPIQFNLIQSAHPSAQESVLYLSSPSPEEDNDVTRELTNLLPPAARHQLSRMAAGPHAEDWGFVAGAGSSNAATAAAGAAAATAGAAGDGNQVLGASGSVGGSSTGGGWQAVGSSGSLSNLDKPPTTSVTPTGAGGPLAPAPAASSGGFLSVLTGQLSGVSLQGTRSGSPHRSAQSGPQGSGLLYSMSPPSVSTGGLAGRLSRTATNISRTDTVRSSEGWAVLTGGGAFDGELVPLLQHIGRLRGQGQLLRPDEWRAYTQVRCGGLGSVMMGWLLAG